MDCGAGRRGDYPAAFLDLQPPCPGLSFVLFHGGAIALTVLGLNLLGNGLRDHVFGPRQDPASQYAAVIPRFIAWALGSEPLEVHGDGTQSRDFTYIDNVVEANLLAATAPGVAGEIFNVGCGSRVSLLKIIRLLEGIVKRLLERRHTARRAGDVPHTQADISKAKRLLGYVPLVEFDEGLRRTVEFFKTKVG